MARVPTTSAVDRPWSAAAAVLTAAHHGFELSSGVGLVLQPELGFAGAGVLWGAQIPLWVGLATRGGPRWDRLLAAWSGASLAGAVLHFLLWPWRRGLLGVPVLTEAEGLSRSKLPAYNAVLYAWGAASVLSIVREVPRGGRRWALVGLATLPLLRSSARHHFTWVHQQAATNPQWWNRGVARD